MSSPQTLPTLPSRACLALEGLPLVQHIGQLHGRLSAHGDFLATSYGRFQTGFKMTPRSVSKPYLTHSPPLAFVPRSGRAHPSEFLHATFLLWFIFARFLFVPRFGPSLLHIWIIATASSLVSDLRSTRLPHPSFMLMPNLI